MTSAKEIALEKLAMQEIYSKCLERMDMGRKDYGVFNPLTDKRDLYLEMENELLDFINYAAMEIVRLRSLR